MAEQTSLLIVPHTHWDREWYRPFEQFRFQLVHAIDLLLDTLEADPQFTHFMLDGQSIVLEDYLEVRPENRERLQNLARAGRIQVGPWYLQPDEFLVGGESLVRNLQTGIGMAEPFGGATCVGYMPDTFGHTGQLPQILRGFGLDNAVLWRGVPPEIQRGAFTWSAPDGSDVLVIWLYDEFGYSNAAMLPLAPAALAIRVADIAHRMSTRAVIPTLLLMNGSDHLEPQAGLPEALNDANVILKKDGLHVRIGTLSEYIRLVRDAKPELERHAGELRSSYQAHLLPGVFSSRMWLKQRNAAVEAELLRWAEPASTWAWMLGARYEGTLLDLAWKHLMHNHPHDSICGCGIDEIHADMMPRFAQSERIAGNVAGQALRDIAAHVDTRGEAHADPIVIFNPTPAPVEGPVVAEVQPRFMPYEVVDEAGSTIPIQPLTTAGATLLDQVVDKQLVVMGLGMVQEGRAMGYTLVSGHLTENESPGVARLEIIVLQSGEPDQIIFENVRASVTSLIARDDVTQLHVIAREAQRTQLLLLAPEVPPLGGRTLYLRAASGVSATGGQAHILRAENDTLENEYLRVGVDAITGELTLRDKATGTVYSGLHRVEDTGDAGDLYTYCPPEHDARISEPAWPPDIELVESGPVRATLRVRRVYRLPVGNTADGRARDQLRTECVITSDVSLVAASRRVEISTQVENTARDHRLRVLFPVPFSTDVSDAEGVFEVVRRPARQPEPISPAPPWEVWAEQPVNTQPQKRFVDVSDGRRGLAVLNRGLPEFELLNPDGHESQVALTLLRCVGWLSQDDLRTRRGPAGPHLPTPEAQGIGTHRFDYALVPHSGGWRENEALVVREADAYEAGLRAITVSQHPGDLPSAWSFLRVDPPGVLVSAIKRSVSGDEAVIRLCNLFENEVEAKLTFFRPVLSARTTNLAEEISGGSPRDLARNLSTNVHTVLRKGEIQTLLVRLGGEENAGR